MKFLVLSLLFSIGVCAQTSPEFTAINQNIAKEYPLFRQIGATYSTLFGAMAIWQGAVILDKDKPGNDHFLAATTVVVGTMRLVDGSIGLFRPGEAEIMAKNNEIKDSVTLKRLAGEARTVRIIRSSLIAANSVLFLALNSKGDEDYKMLIYPGVIMGVISIVNLFRYTPEEKASFDLAPTKNGGALVFNYAF